MKLPSFRIQILIIFLILFSAFAIFTRNFFINEFRGYVNDIKAIELEQKIRNIYNKHKDVVKKEEVEPALSDLYQIQLAADHFEKNIKIYSISIVIFIVLVVFAIFMIFTSMITRPLSRLQEMTEKVAKGDLSARAKESKYSPINKLIVTFNRRISELEASRDKLIQAEKDMMWREMAQVIAHEIKNPLTPLRLSAQRLEQKYYNKNSDFDKVFSDSIEIINDEIDNLQTLVQEFSKFARMPSANFIHYNLNDQIKEIVTPYESKVNIQLDLDGNLPKFYGDKMQMKQVSVNLIQNAIQSIKGSDGAISIITKYESPKFIITIEDNGEGIKDEDINRIFRPYFTKREKGTGLGLAIVKRIVSQHNGRIEVESEKGRGTKFTITFLPKG
ncbi:MAG: ATP-binding protein [Candidatus Cloacimonadota bacterium]|nr:ATP-binding protein [Candidatus Cloacimonadota bacterium]